MPCFSWGAQGADWQPAKAHNSCSKTVLEQTWADSPILGAEQRVVLPKSDDGSNSGSRAPAGAHRQPRHACQPPDELPLHQSRYAPFCMPEQTTHQPRIALRPGQYAIRRSIGSHAITASKVMQTSPSRGLGVMYRSRPDKHNWPTNAPWVIDNFPPATIA